MISEMQGLGVVEIISARLLHLSELISQLKNEGKLTLSSRLLRRLEAEHLVLRHSPHLQPSISPPYTIGQVGS